MVRFLMMEMKTFVDMLMWHLDEPVEVAAKQLLHVIFSVPQISVRLKKINEEHLTMVQFWLNFWNTHKDVLMGGDFNALYPSFSYPLLYATAPGKEVYAVYLNELPVPVVANSDSKKIYIINGSDHDKVLLSFQSNRPRWHVTVYDCMGNVISKSRSSGQQIAEIEVPKTFNTNKHDYVMDAPSDK